MPLDQDTYRKWILPALGVAETIATRGKSPGTTALSQEQIFRDAEESALKKKQIEAQIAEQQSIAQQRALQGQLTPFQIAEAKRNQMRGSEEDAARKALSDAMGLRATDPNVAANDTQMKSLYYKAYPEKYGEALKPAATQLVLGDDQQWHAASKMDGTDTVTHKPIAAPVKPPAGAASGNKEWNKQSASLNKEYKNAVSSSRSGINLGSADLAYKGIQKTLASPTITPADVLIVKDQLIKMVNPGYAITSVQFGHSNLGGVVDKLSNIASQARGTQSLTPKQINEYKGIVSRLGTDLSEQHAAIKDYYSARAHDLSQHNNWLDSDSLKVEPMNYSFDSAGALDDVDNSLIQKYKNARK